MAAENPIPAPRLLLVDEHDLVRARLRSLLEAKTALVVAGEASEGEEAVVLCRQLRPDVVLMGITRSRMGGIEATRLIKAEMSRTAVLVLASQLTEDLLMEAVAAGASGYVLKEKGHEQIVGAVEAVLKGETPLDQGLAMRLLRRIVREAAARGTSAGLPPELPKGVLSERETEVLRLIAAGKTNRQLAKDLTISFSSAKTYVQRIFKKLGVSDRTQASVRAIELGLLPDRERR